jgi:hypothetical protein
MTGSELEKLVRTYMAHILFNYHLATMPIDENRVLLRSFNSAFEIMATPDGVSMTFIDTEDPKLRRYGVDHFLLTARRDRLTFPGARPATHSFAEYTSSDLSLLALHLSAAGDDILRGDRAWLHERPPSNAFASADIRAALSDGSRFDPPPDLRAS